MITAIRQSLLQRFGIQNKFISTQREHGFGEYFVECSELIRRQEARQLLIQVVALGACFPVQLHQLLRQTL